MRQDKALSIYSPMMITNSKNQLFADKFQFFSDCLKIICLKSGEYLIYEVENHISLLKHALFIADCTLNGEFDAGYYKFTIKQLKYLFDTHPLFSNKDTVLTEDLSRKIQIDTFLVSIKDEPIVKNDLSTTLINVHSYIDSILQLMEPDYLDVVIKCIYTKFACRHSLKFHKRDFENLARIIFSYYYLLGRSRETISTFIEKALSSEVNIVGHRIYPKTYIPKDLYDRQISNNRDETKEFDQKLYDDILNHVNKRGSIGQAKSLANIAHYQKHLHHLLFRLDGILLFYNDDSEIEFMGIKILSVEGFKRKWANYDFKSNLNGFFDHGNQSAIVEIAVEAFNIQDAFYQAYDELKYKLGKIMRSTNSRFSINLKHYSFLPEEGANDFFVNPIPEIARINNYEINELKSHLSKIALSAHKNFYIELDDILQQGFLEDNITLSIRFYRKYMEILFQQIDDCNIDKDQNTGIPAEILCMSYLLLFTEKRRFQREIRLWAHNRINNSVFYQSSNNELAHNYRKKIKKSNLLPSFKEILKHNAPEQKHNKHEVTRAMNYSKNIDRMEAFNFYIRQLLFIKQYRDKHEHVNIVDDKIARKLGLYTYRILSQFHRELFFELNRTSNSGKSHGEILKEMVLASKLSITI